MNVLAWIITLTDNTHHVVVMEKQGMEWRIMRMYGSFHGGVKCGEFGCNMDCSSCGA